MQRTEKLVHLILLCHYAYTELEELMNLFIQLYQWKTAILRCKFVQFIVPCGFVKLSISFCSLLIFSCIQCMITHYVNFFKKDVRPVTHI